MIVIKKVLIFCFVIIPSLLKATDNRLFHIDRSKNSNIVCYDVNITDNKIDKAKPLNVYWANSEDVGHRKELTFIQNKLAYGYKTVSKNESYIEISLNAFPDKIIRIEQYNDMFRPTTSINNHIALLKKIYVKADTANSLKVEYIEITGEIIESGEIVSEKIYIK